MSLSMNLDPKSKNEMKRQVRAMLRDAASETRKYATRQATRAEKKAKKLAPAPPSPSDAEYQRTGELQKNIRAKLAANRLGWKLESTARDDRGRQYSIWVENETKFMSKTYKSEKRLLERKAPAIFEKVIQKNSKKS